MANWKRVLGGILLGSLLLPAAACGTHSDVAGTSDIRVTTITSPLALFLPTPFTVTGLNFVSAAGTDATVRFTAVGVTPFAGGTSATADVPATVASNAVVTGVSPTSAFVGSFDAFVTVILPSTAQGTSATAIAHFEGVATDAVDDAYAIVGNTHLTRDAATGLLINDAPTGFTSVVAFDAVSVSGGNVSVAADGAFTYDPPPGYEGVDTFTYDIIGGIGTDTATVSITVTDMVWFIDRSAAAAGDGRQASPFDDIAPFMAIQGGLAEPGDTIFLYEAGGTPYNGPLTLIANQLLIGQGVDLVVGAETLVTATTNPLLTGAAGTTLTLAADNTVRGLNVGNTGGGGIAGTAAGLLSLDTVNVSTTGGPALDLDGVNAAVTFDAVSSTSSATTGVRLANMTGTMLFTGGTVVTNPTTVGIDISVSTGDVTFNDLAITTTTANGLVTAGASTTSVTGSSSFVTTTTGRPLVLMGAIGGGGITFQSIACNGASTGIELGATGALGGLTVTGDGTGALNGSGGTLRNCTGNAITLNGTQSVTLTQLDIDTCGGHGIHAMDVTNLIFEDAQILAAGDADDEYAIALRNVYGAVLIEDVVFDDINEDGINLENSAADDGTADAFTFRRLDIRDHTAAGFGENGISVRATTTADLDVLVSDCVFTVNAEGSLGVIGTSAGTASLEMAVRDCTFDAGAAFGSGCIQLQSGDTSTATFNVLDNDLNASPWTSILVNNDDDSTSQATIRGNDIDADIVTNGGFGISLRQDENGSFTVLVESNTVDGMAFDAIRALCRDTTDGTGVLNITLLDNMSGVPTFGGAGIYLSSADPNTLCANVAGNNVTGTNIVAGVDDDIALTQGGASTFGVTQAAPTAAVDPSEIDDANNSATVGVTGVVTWSQPACPTPPPVL